MRYGKENIYLYENNTVLFREIPSNIDIGKDILLKPIMYSKSQPESLKEVRGKRDPRVLKSLSQAQVFKQYGITSQKLLDVMKYYGSGRVPTIDRLSAMGTNIENQTKVKLFGIPSMTQKHFHLLMGWAYQLDNMNFSVDI